MECWWSTISLKIQRLADVVHQYSHTGHDYPHFTEAEFQYLSNEAGFGDVRVHGCMTRW